MDVDEPLSSDDEREADMEPLPLPTDDEQLAEAPDKSTEWTALEDRHIRLYVDWLIRKSKNSAPLRNTQNNFCQYCKVHNKETLKLIRKSKTWDQVCRRVNAMRSHCKFLLQK